MKRITQLFVSMIILISLLIPSGLEFAGRQISGVQDVQAAETTFAVITDYGYTNDTVATVTDMVNSWKPEFIVTAGDNSQGSICSPTTCYPNVVGAYYGPQVPITRTDFMTDDNFYPVPGNHDYYAGGTGELGNYLAYFTSLITLPPSGAYTGATNRYYDFRRGPVHFFMLDSGENLDGSPYDVINQKAWLQSALEENSEAPWKIVVFHVPAYSSGTTHGDSEAMQWPFETWGADFVISGHNHNYDRIYKGEGGLRYFTAGTAGSDRRACSTTYAGREAYYCDTSTSAESGAMKVTASDTSITFEYITTNGTDETQRDTYTQTKSGETGAVTTNSWDEAGTYTWTAPTGVTSVTVECWGGGGGGGDDSSGQGGGGGGGGGGAYARVNTFSVTSGQTYSVVVGAGGGAATAGSASSFNTSTCVAAGGGGGTSANSGAGGAGGTVAASAGDDIYAGGTGAAGYTTGWITRYGGGGGGSGGTSNTGNSANDDQGADAVSGGGPGGDGGENSAGSSPSIGPGGGGGGGEYSNESRSGGSGYDGQVVITWTGPSITVTPNALSFYSLPSTVSGIQIYTVSGSELENVITISLSSTTDFEISTDGNDWSTTGSLELTPIDGTVSKTIYVRMKELPVGTYSGSITHTSVHSSGDLTATVSLSGTVSDNYLGMVINGGIETTGSPRVILDMSFGGTEPAYMRFQNVPIGQDCPTGGTGWSTPEAYASTASWTLNFTGTPPSNTSEYTIPDGDYKVCAQASDSTNFTNYLATSDTIHYEEDYISTNPDLSASCGLDLVLVVDLSSSIRDELDAYKEALVGFIEALKNTPTNLSIVTFNYDAEVTQDWLKLTTTNAGAIETTINNFGWEQGTNWDDGLRKARLQFSPLKNPSLDNPDLMVFLTDGDPSKWAGHGEGDSIPTDYPGYDAMTQHAIPEADEAKAAGIHILGLGVAGTTISRLQAISGDELFDPTASNIKTADYYVSESFSALTGALEDLVIELCGGTVTVNKVVTGYGTDKYDESRWVRTGSVVDDWTFTVTAITGGTVEVPGKDTGTDGYVNYEVDLGGESATLTILETVKSGYEFVDVVCTRDGESVTLGEATNGASGIPVVIDSVTNCTFINFDPDPTGVEDVVIDFAASVLDQAALLNWESLSEGNISAFVLYRAVSGGEMEQIALIPAMGGVFNEYKHIDHDVSVGVEYEYYLEVRNLYDEPITPLYGPARLIIPEMPWKIFLPITSSN